jgi:putative FmdB family regulatory protein
VPVYEYQCLPHGHRFEVRQGINDPPIKTCSECGGEVRRVIHPVGIVFKGSGFYVTDSRSSSSATQPASSSKDSNKESKSEGSPPASTDSKSVEKESKSNASAPKSDKKESSASSQ